MAGNPTGGDAVAEVAAGLSDAITSIRSELTKAMSSSEESEIRFRLGPVELEFELEARNLPSEEGGYHLTDGRMTMAIVPWKISSFNGAGIEQPGMDHIGFRVPDIKAFEANRDMVAKTNIQLAPKPIPFDAEGAARLALLQKCPHGAVQLADPDGTLIDVAQDHS